MAGGKNANRLTGINQGGSKEISGKQNKGYPIGATILIIVLVAVLFMLGSETCKSFDEGRPFTLFGVILTVGIFALLVVLVTLATAAF